MKRKRVVALCRAPDGSAFRTCEKCQESVLIALTDMHICCCGEPVEQSSQKHNFKRFKGPVSSYKPDDVVSTGYQPRSPFRFFMEEFQCKFEMIDLVDIDRKGFETWMGMSATEREPFVQKAEIVNLEYARGLLRETEDYSWMNDEGDSAQVGKCD